MYNEKNYQELLSILLTDYLDCLRFINSKSKKVRKKILQSTNFPVTLGPFEYETKSERKYLIYITGYSKKDCLNPFSTIVNYSQSTIGYNANTIILNSNGINVISYIENVFKSYKNYYYEDTASDFEVLKEFFKTNSTNISHTIGNKLILKCEDGLLTGYKPKEEIKIMHAFTPNELIESELSELSDSMQNELERIFELKSKSII